MIKKVMDSEIKQCLNTVLGKIEAASKRKPEELRYINPVLVAVSKTKPTNQVVEAYNHGQRHFGENYVNELFEKGNNTEILEKCKDIKWHFIGHLQRNKLNKILAVPNLFLVETVDSQKLATALDNAWPKFSLDNKLKVMVQVNTSGEDVKNGVSPDAVVDIGRHIIQNCSNLKLEGLMTIGKYGYDPNDGPNPDFLCLKRCKDALCDSLKLEPKLIHLSMGMSTDYEQAIELGSSFVRVGTAIFGSRQMKE